MWPKPKGIITGIFEASIKKNQDISEDTKQFLGFGNKDVENEVLGCGSLGYSHLWIALQQVKFSNRSFTTSTPNLKPPFWLFLQAWYSASGCKYLATEVHFGEGDSTSTCYRTHGQEDFPGCTGQTRPGVPGWDGGNCSLLSSFLTKMRHWRLLGQCPGRHRRTSGLRQQQVPGEESLPSGQFLLQS